jgi:hypothetical protein
MPHSYSVSKSEGKRNPLHPSHPLQARQLLPLPLPPPQRLIQLLHPQVTLHPRKLMQNQKQSLHNHPHALLLSLA